MTTAALETMSLIPVAPADAVEVCGKPDPNGGPFWFFFEPVGFHPTASDHEVFAAAALLVQDGRYLARFGGIALEEFSAAPGWWRTPDRKERAANLGLLTPLANNDALNEAFGLFYGTCWKLVLKTFTQPDKNVKLALHEVVERGWLQVVSNGLFRGMENHFFHRALRGGESFLREQMGSFGMAELCHPYIIHGLHSLLVGFGYRPTIADSVEALSALGSGSQSVVLNPRLGVENMALLLQAARCHDSRLDDFRLGTAAYHRRHSA